MRIWEGGYVGSGVIVVVVVMGRLFLVCINWFWERYFV